MTTAGPRVGAVDPGTRLASVETSLARFDPAVLKLRESWLAHDIAPGHTWRRTSPNESSDSRPFNVEDQQNGWRGKAKPGDTNISDIPRAAHDKTVSDLAGWLDLPVPPFPLYDPG